jgi:alkylation response protein AidB-like acyl-CoA dehydrogenase
MQRPFFKRNRSAAGPTLCDYMRWPHFRLRRMMARNVGSAEASGTRNGVGFRLVGAHGNYTMNATDREKEMAQAEEILGERLQKRGFVKGLFFGQCDNEALPEYPGDEPGDDVRNLAADLDEFCRQNVDPVAIDRNAEIPPSVVQGLGKLGVLGACLPKSCGGMALSQVSYCRLLEVLGGHCASTALFVNAHHSIGPRSLVLFGTPEQQQKWLPKLASGQWISAFALTEPEAGSDAANVQSTAMPEPDGSHYVLNGEKRWITNGGIAQVLTVMARTPVPGRDDTQITAFIVTPDMPGFEVVERRMEKCGVRGTATSRLAFHNVRVPRENLLGQLGKGLRVALTVLDFGRTTFGGSCTGAAKRCLELARSHAHERIQFGRTLDAFEMVQEKLANMAAASFAMQACTYQTAALIDAGVSEFMLETAMLKVFSTEQLWRIVYDAFQIYGGKAYFTDEPLERMMRDARINSIGEGANDVLRAFTALVGMRDVGLELKGLLEAIQSPLGHLSRIGRFAGRKLTSLFGPPEVLVRSGALEDDARHIGRNIAALASNVERLLRTWREEVVDRQLQLGRIADAATELYVSVCVLRRLDEILRHAHGDGDEASTQLKLETGRYYLRTADRRIRRNFADLWDNDDATCIALARKLRGES